MKDALKRNMIIRLLFPYCIVLAIILSVYYFIGIYPFGNKTILKIDLYHVYAPILNQLKEGILGDSSTIYSWFGGLGENILGQFIYLAASPFNFIIFLFPEKLLTESIALLILLKIPCSAVTCTYFIKEKYNYNFIYSILFSIMYALCSFITALYWNLMWIDAIILLPLVALGIERLVKKDKKYLYCTALALSIFTNFYIAVYICIFSVIYFIVIHITEKTDKDYRKFFKSSVCFIKYSLLAGGLSAIVIIPIYFILQSSHYLDGAMPKNINLLFPISEFLTNHYFGMKATDVQGVKVVPNVYIGVLTVVLVPYFFINKEIKRREKICYFAILIIIFLFFEVNILSFIIHGFHFPAGLPHRFSFVYSFFLLIIAAGALEKINYIPKKQFFAIMLSSFGFFSFVGFSSGLDSRWIPGHFTQWSIMANISFMIVYFYLLYIIVYKNRKQLKQYLIVGMIIIELFFNTKLSFESNAGGGGNLPNRDNYVIKNFDAMEEIKSRLDTDNGFYRAAFRRLNTANDAKLYHYKGLSMFISPVYGDVVDFYQNIGITAGYNSAKYIDPAPIVNSILSVKYLFNKEKEIQNTLFDYKFQVGDIFVYENPYALPLGFMVKDTILDWNNTKVKNPFEVQEAFVTKGTGLDSSIYSKFLWDSIKYENITISKEDNTTVYHYKVINPFDLDQIPNISYQFTASESKHMYISYYAPVSGIELQINGVKKIILGTGRTRNGTFDIGFVEAGDQIEVKLKFANKDLDNPYQYIPNGSCQLFAAQLDLEQYKSAIQQLGKSELNITSYSDTAITGDIDTIESGILYLSIPYDKNWKVKVNGRTTNQVKLGGALTGIWLEQGSHHIVMEYHQKGLAIGCIISISSAIILIGSWYFNKKRGELSGLYKVDEN